MRRISLVLALAAVSISQVWAVYGVNTGPGSSDTTFTWVGQVNGASGVIIDPHWVLTAQHVNGSVFTLDGTNYTADAVYDAPTYDLHLMHFTNTFAGSYQLYSGNALGQTATLVGFGGTGTVRPDGKGFDEAGSGGVRRAATNIVGLQQSLQFGNWDTPCIIADLDAPNGNSLASPWNRDWFGDGGPTSNEGGLMGGDSGGGWFINGQLAGISNYIGWDDTVFPNESHFYEYGVSFSSAADLTDAGVRQWVTSTVPEPASSAAILIGLAGAIARRKKKA